MRSGRLVNSFAERSRARGWFIAGSGTGVGKTFVARGIVRALALQGRRVAAVKPIETGCAPYPLDAMALADASGNRRLADHPAWYRAELPASPYAIELSTRCAAPDVAEIVAAIRALEVAHDAVVVEGAGGVLVPLDRTRTMADLALQIGYPILLVADDRLGVLSHVLCAYEAARSRGHTVAAIVLTHPQRPDASDPSVETNARILSERLACPVCSFPHVPDGSNDELAEAARTASIVGVLGY